MVSGMGEPNPDWSAIEREVEEALLATQGEDHLALEEVKRQLVGNLPESMRILTITTNRAAVAMREFAATWQRGEEADFMEIVNRYDDPPT